MVELLNYGELFDGFTTKIFFFFINGKNVFLFKRLVNVSVAIELVCGGYPSFSVLVE